ncbi:MAG: S8 family serine peptidase, partial [Thermoanaerobaculia bacterium]|nr:S8 family serine peptidase [Thermoanaerobaculia bacterium]
GDAYADDRQEPSARPAPRAYEVEHEPASLEDLEERARRSRFRPRHSLASYWRLDARDLEAQDDQEQPVAPEHGFPYSNAALTRRLVYELGELSEVDLAYREVAAADPALHAGSQDAYRPPLADELADHQLHLGEMPLGLDVAWLRHLLDGLDCGLAVADLEQGWIVDHADLPPVELVEGDNRHGEEAYVGDHGTAVVSELAGMANSLGVIGFVPDTTRVKLASHYRNEGGGRAGSGHVADALVALMTGDRPALGPGDVVLLEVQRSGRPTEIDPLDFDAIRLAVGNGICVVEAAGNGNVDLDRLETDDGRSLDRRSLDFSDSGAILVGAASASPPHARSRSSSYGSRVDCFAWGNGVVAAGYGDFFDGGGADVFTDTFSGTSSAAPMIAGAAVLLQSAYRVGAYPGHQSIDVRTKSLSPGQIRSILSSPRTGVRQGRGVAGYIGVMPNVRVILEGSQRLVPQVYLRDHEGDEGVTPYRFRACASPDIVVGEGEVRVRLRNRGLRTAEGVGAALYGAPVTTLVTPDRWRPLGDGDSEVTVPKGAVPQGDTPVESTALAVAEEVLRSGCLIAVVRQPGRVGRPRGPEPQPASAFDWSDFRAAMRSRNHFAVLNAPRVDFDPGSDRIALPPFAINGTPDVPRLFHLLLHQALPEGAWIELRAPLGLGLALCRGRLWKPVRDAQ